MSVIIEPLRRLDRLRIRLRDAYNAFYRWSFRMAGLPVLGGPGIDEPGATCSCGWSIPGEDKADLNTALAVHIRQEHLGGPRNKTITARVRYRLEGASDAEPQP